jgi:AraC-like DNA-binding protein
MNEAYYLLKERGMNVAECALRCGYADPAYFSRVFKKHFGFSPKNID